ncbi:MAG: signal peptidase II [Candidatus Magasanikbacteria bacterium]|nr:signal peptidase II [Candidatus Magasanikbacteria bacterium]
MRRIALIALILIITLDRLFKYIAFKQSLLSSGEIARFGILSFTPFLNNRLAFSLPLPLAVIIIVSLGVIASMLIYFFKLKNYFQRFALIFVIAGALSNLFDRITYHAVIDYLSIFPHGFFNIADVMIGCGIVALLLMF